MNPGALRKNILAHDGFVGRNVHTGIGFDYAADVVDPSFDHSVRRLDLVVQYGNHARQWRIARPLAETVDGRMNAVYSRFYRRHHIGDRQVIIVVRMEIEPDIRITPDHLAAKSIRIVGIEDPQRIGNHETSDRSTAQGIHHIEHVLRRMDHTVGPIFQIKVHRNAHPRSLRNRRADILHMLLRSLA